jgi:hypothetical protein
MPWMGKARDLAGRAGGRVAQHGELGHGGTPQRQRHRGIVVAGGALVANRRKLLITLDAIAKTSTPRARDQWLRVAA